MRLALDSGAVRKIGRDAIVNVKELNRYIVEGQEREKYEKLYGQYGTPEDYWED